MKQTFTARSGKEVRVVLSALVSIAPIWATAAQPIAELGIAIFLAGGLTYAVVGAWAPWVIVATCALGAAVRSADIEAWALLIPGGSVGCARRAFGERIARVAAAMLLAERLLFAALATLIAGSYVANAPLTAAAVAPLTRHLTTMDVSTVLASLLVAFFWIRSRMGLSVANRTRVNAIWLSSLVVAAIVVWGVLTPPGSGPGWWWPLSNAGMSARVGTGAWSAMGAILVAVAFALPVVGGSDTLSRTASRLPLPRLPPLRRIGRSAVVAGLVLAALPT